MKEVINKWELILEKHDGKDITYGRKVLIELLTDVKTAFMIDHIDVLEKYTKFLQKEGYIDTDATCEEPYAIDEFMKEMRKKS